MRPEPVAEAAEEDQRDWNRPPAAGSRCRPCRSPRRASKADQAVTPLTGTPSAGPVAAVDRQAGSTTAWAARARTAGPAGPVGARHPPGANAVIDLVPRD
jgi:hypothetical protein